VSRAPGPGGWKPPRKVRIAVPRNLGNVPNDLIRECREIFGIDPIAG